MQRISVATQRADGKSMIVQRLLEFLERVWVVKHGELAMRIAGIIAGAQLYRADAVSLQLCQHVFKRQLRKEGRKYSQSHLR